MYFEAMAKPAAMPKKYNPPTDWVGAIISAKISAVAYTDSMLLGTSKTRAKIKFIAQQTTVINTTETTRAVGVYGNNPKKLKIKAATQRDST